MLVGLVLQRGECDVGLGPRDLGLSVGFTWFSWVSLGWVLQVVRARMVAGLQKV